MSNVVPMFDHVIVWVCECGNDKFFLHRSPSEILTLVCTECLHGITGFNITGRNN